MYTPPLHRKLLPWLYAAIFLIIAPALIFYTSGYRYNLKKAAIEKYGTLITDSTPAGASVLIDDQDAGDTTPATFQEMTPGLHRVRIQKDRYLPWEKTLEIRQERATFADHVHLWRAEPDTQFLFAGDIRSMASNPDQDTLALLNVEAGSSTHLMLVQAKGRVSLDAPVRVDEPSQADIEWQADSRAIAIEEPDASTTLARFVARGVSTTSTVGGGFWQENAFVSFAPRELRSWNSRNGTMTVEPLPADVRERISDFSLQNTTTTSQLLFDRTFSSKAFSLPAGAWSFERTSTEALLLRDGDRWLSLNPRQDQPFLGSLEGDRPRWITLDDGRTQALFIHNNELWLWQTGDQPQLLVRESTPIREAVWHASGDAVFIASDTGIDVLDLDVRDGQIRHTLATFDRVNDVDMLGKVLYVAGSKNGQNGLWSVTIE